MKKTASILIIILILASFCYFHVKNVYASAFSDGFENDFTPWTSTSGDPETSTSIKYQGAKSFNHTIVSPKTLGANTTWAKYDMTDDTDWWLEAYVYIESFNPSSYGSTGGASNNYCPILRLDTNGPHCIEMGIDKESSGANVTVYGGNREGPSLSRQSEINLSEWYLFEVHGWYEGTNFNWSWSLNGVIQAESSVVDSYGDKVTELYVGANYGAWNTTDTGNATWFIDSTTLEGKTYYFNFNFYDLDNQDVELYVDWALWNSTHDIGYTEGEASLYAGTYTLKTSKYGRVINTTTLDTATYGNSTINIYLNMKRHQTTPNGFIVSNDTISSITVHQETPQLLNFTISGSTPAQLGVGVSKNASHITDTKGVTVDLNRTVSHSYDDAHEKGNGPFYYDGNYLDVESYSSGGSSNYRCAGFLFKNIDLASDTIVTGASVEVYVHSTSYDDMNCKIFAHAHDNAGNFRYGGTVIARPRTEANVSWVEDSLGTGWKSKSGLQDVVTEIITRAGWTSGNNIALLFIANIGATKWTTLRAYDLNVIYGAKLSIQYLSSGNFTEWTYSNSPSHINFVRNYFSTITMHFPASDQPDVGPNPSPSQHRVVVTVRLNGEWLRYCNVTVTGGPDNIFEWGLTDVFGRSIFRLKTGSYDIVATYEGYWKKKPIYVSKHMTIGIEFTETDYFPEGLPTDKEIGPAWVGLPELDFTSEVILVFLLPLIILIIYAVKKALEGPQRKWKYSYLR